MSGYQQRSVARTGAVLINPLTGKWLVPADIDSTLLVFIHGFTANGEYLREQAEFVRGFGYSSAIFQYDSYLGIDKAAHDLLKRLAIFRDHLRQLGYVLIAHSMGGLVARHAARLSMGEMQTALRGVAMLGTPNRGALGGITWVDRLLDWSENFSPPNPYFRHPLCRAAKQLSLSDREGLIKGINEQDHSDPLALPYLSISGGMQYLELGRWIGRLKNEALQRMIDDVPNDGLVGESSADLSNVITNGRVIHRNDYASFSRTNHTNLVKNQEVAGLILDWLAEEVDLEQRAVGRGMTQNQEVSGGPATPLRGAAGR